MLLKQPTRQMFVNCGAAPKAAEALKSDSTDDEFLLSRILFLLTYGSDADFEKLAEDHHLASNINSCVARHAKRYCKALRRMSYSSPMDDMALTETTKLMFNITHHCPDLTQSFSKSIPHLMQILNTSKISDPPLDPPLSSIVNALLNLDLAGESGLSFTKSAFFPRLNCKGPMEHIVNILDATLVFYKEADLEAMATPIVSLIRKVYPITPCSVKKHLEHLLLPTDSDRNKPIGQANTLSSRLLRLSTSAITPALRTSISAMLFELSDSDASKFVHNVGYGYAAGFLMGQNMPIPESASDAFANTQAGAINPITGQMRAAEDQLDGGPPMTDEEKEMEAEKLFVLFERLKKTGVVDVINPVQAAIDSGRFEELPDDA